MEGEGHLNLRWNDHTHTFVHLLDHYRLQELYCDASLACAGGVVYPVHKVVLSACSDFFASIFASANCQNPVVVLQDVPTHHLEALLTYVYCGEVLLARPHLQAFLKVAESLQVKGLATPPLIPLPCGTWGSSGVFETAQQSPLHPKQHPSRHTRLPPPYLPPDSAPYPRSGCDGVRGSAAPLHTTAKPPGSAQGDGDSLRPPRKRFSPHFASSESFRGTFQNLVASEEGDIKEEPLEEQTDFLQTDTLTIYEGGEEETEMEEEEMKEEQEEMMKEGERRGEEKQDDGEKDTYALEDEGRKEGGEKEDDREGETEGGRVEVKVMVEARHPEHMNTSSSTTHSGSPSLSIHSPTPSHYSYSSHSPSPSLSILSPTPSYHTRSPTHPHALSPIPAHSPMPSIPTTPPSQLRQELLKPPQHRVTPTPLLATPHPVIGEEGEGEEMTREPPPLVKIPVPSPVSVSPHGESLGPLQFRHHQQQQQHRIHHHHHRHYRQNEDQENTTTTTPTTTTTITTPPPFTSTPHNKTHHLLVTTQPTYRHHLPPPPQSTGVPPSPYLPTPCHYKNLHLMDTDAPLNLSQDTQHGRHRTQHGHTHTHRHRTPHNERHRDGDPFLGKILTNRKRRLRGPKSWEYLVRLLRDPSTNPSLIRWESEARGVFRLVQPAAIAQRWGRRTGKHASDCLTYENFARGLRYHYATGALEPVSERSFVYKFGPKAHLALGDGEVMGGDGGGGGDGDGAMTTTVMTMAHAT